MITLAQIQEINALVTRLVRHRRLQLNDQRHPIDIADSLLAWADAPDLSTVITALRAEVERAGAHHRERV